MKSFSTGMMQFVPRSPRAVVQIGLAAIGTIVILGSLAMAGSTLATMPPSESGFAEGLAVIVFGLYALVGFVILAAGLLIPQPPDDEIHCTRTQQKLLAYGVIAPVVSVLAVPIGATILPPLTESVMSVLVAVLVVLVVSGPLATLVALGSMLRSTRG